MPARPAIWSASYLAAHLLFEKHNRLDRLSNTPSAAFCFYGPKRLMTQNINGNVMKAVAKSTLWFLSKLEMFILHVWPCTVSRFHYTFPFHEKKWLLFCSRNRRDGINADWRCRWIPWFNEPHKHDLSSKWSFTDPRLLNLLYSCTHNVHILLL